MAQEAIAEARFIYGCRAEGVNLLDREHAVIDIYERTKTRNAGWPAKVRSRERAEKRCMGEEELAGDEVIWTYVVVDIGIDLFFVIGGQRRARGSAPGSLRRRDEKLTVGKLEIKQLQRNGIDRGDLELIHQSRRGAVVGQARRNQDVLVQALIRGAVRLSCALIRNKEECLVLAQGAAQGGPIHIVPHLRTAKAHCIQICVISVERFIAEILVPAPAQGVGAGPSHDLHASACACDRGVI